MALDPRIFRPARGFMGAPRTPALLAANVMPLCLRRLAMKPA